MHAEERRCLHRGSTLQRFSYLLRRQWGLLGAARFIAVLQPVSSASHHFEVVRVVVSTVMVEMVDNLVGFQ